MQNNKDQYITADMRRLMGDKTEKASAPVGERTEYTFYITETCTYEVQAENREAALDKFLTGDITDFPVTVDEREISEPNDGVIA